MMAITRTNTAAPLPRWVVVAGSGVIVFHLFAIVVFVLAAPSGPWSTPFGPSTAFGPFFVEDINNATSRYLSVIHLAHDYHFQADQTDLPAVYFEAKLRDKAGKVIGTLKFPQDKANFWVRHRQSLLAQGLGDDRPPEGARGSNPIAAPGQKLKDIPVWERIGNTGDSYKLGKKQTITPDLELMAPSARSILLVKAYARYLGRQHEAASVELIRHSRNGIMPEMVYINRQRQVAGVEQTPYSLNEMVANFGVEEVADEK